MASEAAEASDSVFAVSATNSTADFLSWTKAQNVVIEVYQLFCLLFVRLVLSLLSVPHVKLVLSTVGLGALITEASDKSTANAWTPAPAAATISASHRASLLPPRHPKDSNRLTIVLDLDETLICAYNSLALPGHIHAAAASGGVRWFSLQCNTLEQPGAPAEPSQVTVYERPGLAEFLRRANAIGEVVLFTAGLEGYARPLVDRIDLEGRISARLYRPSTCSTPMRDHVKDLSRLGRDLRRTVIIDNNPFSFLLQPENGVPCVPFFGHQADDTQLLEVLLPLLEQLVQEDDVRPVLREKFGMAKWFRQRGFATDSCKS